MDNVLNFNNHIDKKQNKQRYLGYEKGNILEETIKGLITRIPDIPDDTIISYFIKIVQGKLSIMQNKHFHTRYVWSEKYLKHSSAKIQIALLAYMFNNKDDHKLLYHLSLLIHLLLYFFNEKVASFYKIEAQEYEKWCLRLLDKSIEFKNKVRDGNL